MNDTLAGLTINPQGASVGVEVAHSRSDQLTRARAGLRAGRDKLTQPGLTGVYEPLSVALVENDLACCADVLEIFTRRQARSSAI